MLRSLLIENVAVIEQAEIAFDRGFSVLTGETGAGKSIIIDSLGAILGNRVSRELIRTGQSRACVTALFDDLPAAARVAADKQGFPCEDGQLLLRREIFADGRNACRINGAPAALPMLRELGRTLVSISGQHDGQQLLNEQLHIEYLDAFGGLEGPLEEYYTAYEELLQLNRRLKALSMSAEEQARRLAQLPEEIGRLRDAAVRPGEQEELLSLRSQMLAGERLFESLSEALAALDGTEEQTGGTGQLDLCERALRPAAKLGAEYEALQKRAKELQVLTADFAGDLSGALARLDFSRERMEEAERRLDVIERLCARTGVPADGLEEHLAALENELAALENRDDGLDALKAAYAAKRQTVYDLAGGLHERRVAAAEELAGRIAAELRELDMPAARFSAQVDDLRRGTQAHFTKKGTDSVRFLLSTNLGEDLKALAHVASGGELSRIMLALKNVLGGHEAGVTAVFDEVDAGVSGRAASRVGEKLYAISGGRQVLCVTHLPQIACLADRQYHISKYSRDGRTFTRVRELDDDGRTQELARLTAGLHITDATLDGARALLQQAREYKKSLTK